MDSILRQGSKGNAVIELQQILQAKGFYSGKVDGDFGAGTANAVLKFQRANGLTADAIVGANTWKILRSKPAPTFTTLILGAKGTAVSQMQQLLKDKGYYQGRIDGDFGTGTRDAVTAFQRANGLTVDGKVGEQTWKRLQAPAIATTPPVTETIETVEFIEIVRPSAPEIPANPNPPSPANPTSPVSPVSIFIPTAGEVTTPNPPAAVTSNALSLIDAANRYSRGRLANQTIAINNLQNNIAADLFQQFLQRWQVASGQSANSLQEAFGSYNSTQMLNQNLALQWLQLQLLPQTLEQFRQDWANLAATTIATSVTPPVANPPIVTPPEPTLQFLSLTDAIKVYDRNKYPHQVTALEKLQASVPAATMQQFFQRWTLASLQTAIAISLLDVFKDYDSQKFPNQINALQWLEKELTAEQTKQFSEDWQGQIAI